MKRGGYIKRTAMARSFKPMKKAGKRTNDWRKAWRFLKAEFEKRGRTRCEFDFIPHTCCGPLDPAHSKKRRMMKGNDIYAVAIACRRVHQMLDEEMPHDSMEAAVMKAIHRNGGLILPERLAA